MFLGKWWWRFWGGSRHAWAWGGGVEAGKSVYSFWLKCVGLISSVQESKWTGRVFNKRGMDFLFGLGTMVFY